MHMANITGTYTYTTNLPILENKSKQKGVGHYAEKATPLNGEL